MKIDKETKLDVNSYMIGHFTNKGTIGYLYFKLFIEVCYEKYKELGYIPNYTIPELVKLAEVDITAQGCQRSLNYFFKVEGLTDNISDILIDTTEKVIEATRPKIIEEDEF